MSRGRLLIVQENQSHTNQPIWEDLSSRGYEVVRLRLDDTPAAVRRGLRPDAVILDMITADEVGAGSRYRSAAGRLLQVQGHRMPVLAVGQTGLSDLPAGVAAVKAGPGSAAQMLNRIAALRRLSTMQAELTRRMDVSAAFRVTLPDSAVTGLEADGEILVVGTGRRFLRVEGLLASHAMITGAMTARTAFDYLDRKPFDAVLLDMEPGDIASFLSGIRNHPAHFDLPVIVLGADDRQTADWIDQGATDVVDDGCLDGDLRRITLDLVREQRFRRSLRAVYARGRHLETNDSLTGLYSRGFLMAHLQRACQDAALRGEVFSVAGFNVQGLHETNLEFGYAAGDRVLRQIGVMMARLSRAEDLAARYGGHFVLVMPGTTLEESERPVERICGIIRATELVLPEGGRSRAELTTRRVLLDPEEGIEAMLDRLFK